MLENVGFININIDRTNSIYLIISAEINK